MGDIMKRDEFPSTTSLSKMGVSAVGYTAAGIFLAVLNAIAGGHWLPGVIAGGVVTLLGFGSFSSKDPADKKAGLILTAAGALTVLSSIPIPVISGFSKVLLGLGVFGLLALGVINAVKFFRGLKQRS